LVVVKPAMLATMGTSGERASLLDQAKAYIKAKYQKPGNVYLGVVSRLDAPVTGVLVIARTSKAASRLTEQFRARTVEKTYWAAVEGTPRPASGELLDYVRKDERHRKMHVANKGAADAKEARLTYRTLQPLAGGALLEVELDTGRKHQIRLQLAHAGHPILGDRKYGSRRPFPRGVALHARRLAFDHPTRGERLDFTAPPPDSWRGLGVGGFS
jgi:23S rRNA pseudouridine1911/1915/1917 synthase